MAVADRSGLPVAVSVESATPHEVKLAKSTPGTNGDPRTATESNRRQRLRLRQIGH
jgi:hypothetical protein